MRNFIDLSNKIYEGRILTACILAIALAGCSSISDKLNPVEWYKGARDRVESASDMIMGNVNVTKQEDKVSSDKVSLVDAKKTFPRLSTVPKLSKRDAQNRRQRVASELVGDNEKARQYSSETSTQKTGVEKAVPLPPSLVKPLSNPRRVQTNASGATNKYTKQAGINGEKLGGHKKSAKLVVPSVNPISSAIAVLPGLIPALGLNQTVVVSGNGVQKMRSESLSRISTQDTNVRVSNQTSYLKNNANKLKQSYQVATILFPNGSSRVGVRDRRVLRKVMLEHKKVGGTLRIVGHASRRTKTNDPLRHKMVNFVVSAARADGVANELIKMGVKASQLIVGSVSDSKPLYFEYMPSGEAGNRRTDIFIDF
jgi:flagellar motor protein MotB